MTNTECLYLPAISLVSSKDYWTGYVLFWSAPIITVLSVKHLGTSAKLQKRHLIRAVSCRRKLSAVSYNGGMEFRRGAGGQPSSVTVTCQFKVTIVNNGLERPRQPHSQQKEDECWKQQDLGEGMGINLHINRNKFGLSHDQLPF